MESGSILRCLSMLIFFVTFATNVSAMKIGLVRSLPEEYQKLSTLSIHANRTAEILVARGEGEPFAIVLSDCAKKPFNVQVENLPTANWIEFSVHRVGWVNVAYPAGRVVRKPDPLIPVRLGAPICVEDDHCVLWCRIALTPNAPALPKVQFTVVVDCNNEVFKIPVNVKIAPITIPSEIPLTIQAALSPHGISKKEYSPSEVLAAFAFFAKYRINSAAGASNADRLRVPSDAFYQELLTGSGMKKARIGFVNAKKRFKNLRAGAQLSSEMEIWKQSIKKVLNENQDLIKKHPNVFLFKIWDEPRKEEYPIVRDLYDYVGQFGLPVLTEVTAPPEREIERCASIYIPRLQDINITTIKRAQNAGKKVFFYANSMHSLRRPYHTMRNIGWLAWALGLDGYHIWCMNCWAGDPFNQLHGKEDLLGRGFFVYPGASSEIFYPSIRLEMLREGLEDYLLLKQSSLMGNSKISKAIAQYVGKEYKFHEGKKAYLNDPKPMHDRILEMALKNVIH